MIIEDNFCQSFIKTYVVGAHKNCLGEAVLMSTHNIGFYEEISKKKFPIVKYHQIRTLLSLNFWTP